MADSSNDDNRRLIELDALRGIAVLGIVLMNVYVFAMPQQAYLNPVAWGDGGASDILVWAFNFLFVEDKFRTLFAMLFGAGVCMILAKNDPRKWQHHFARMFVLFLIGLVHAILLANNDILRGYAMAGLLLPLLVGLPQRMLLAGSALLLLTHVAGGLYAMGGISPYAEQFQELPPSNPAIIAFAEQNYGSDPTAISASMTRGEESLAERIDRRIARVPATTMFVAGSIPLNLAAMLVGIMLWKSGFLSGSWSRQDLLRLAYRLILVAVPGLILLAGVAVMSGFSPLIMGANGLFLSEPFDLVMGTAYAALAIAAFQGLDRSNILLRRLAAAGRMALSNYLGTSMILAFLFAAWGLGWFWHD